MVESGAAAMKDEQVDSLNAGTSRGMMVWAVAAGLLVIAAAFSANAAAADQNTVVKEGKKLAFDRRKGNCLACHHVVGAESPGNIAPPLIAMKARFPRKKDLRARIWDMTQFKPEVMMPPFGKHEILTEEEIDKITEYVWSL